jgi:hypothetical protein
MATKHRPRPSAGCGCRRGAGYAAGVGSARRWPNPRAVRSPPNRQGRLSRNQGARNRKTLANDWGGLVKMRVVLIKARLWSCLSNRF